MNSIVSAKLIELIATLAGYGIAIVLTSLAQKLVETFEHSKATGATKEVQDIINQAVKWGVASAQKTDWEGEQKKKYVVDQAINFLKASPFKGDAEKYRHNIEDTVEYVLQGVNQAIKDESKQNGTQITVEDDGMPKPLPLEENAEIPLNADVEQPTQPTQATNQQA